MAEKVEVVIKIPKYYLTHPQDYSCLAECVRRGVPLPKGHGRLIDADKLHQDIFDDDCWQFSGGISPNEGYSWKQVQNAPTIIESDKED